MIIRSVDLLEVLLEDEKRSTRWFRKGDIVEIDFVSRCGGILSREVAYAKIKFIDTNSLEVDASLNLDSRILIIKYEDIRDIKLKENNS